MRAFRHRDYRIFWAGALASNTGTWLTNLAVPFVLYEITRSAFWVGLAALAQFLPSVLCAPLGGAIADRYERRRVLLMTQTGLALAATVLWAVWVAGPATPISIMAAVSMTGVFVGLNLPSWQSFVNDLVPRRDLPSAVALNSLQFNAARSIGPAIAGVLLATLGPGWAFGLNAISFCGVLTALALVRQRVTVERSSRSEVFRGFAAAVGYIRQQPGVQIAIGISVLLGFLANPIFNLTVVFAEDVFAVGAFGLGMMNAALGLGAFFAAPLVSGWRGWSRARLVQWALLLNGVGLMFLGLAPNIGVAVVALVAVGACFLATVASANTAIQMIVADHVRGRVLAVRIMVFTASFPAGALVQGWLTDWIGPQVTVMIAGALLALVGVLSLVGRGRRALDRLDDPRDETRRSDVLPQSHPGSSSAA